VTASIDWREDASLPPRVLPWRTWTLSVFLPAVVMAAVVVIVTGPVSNMPTSLCRLHEAREGVRDLEKIDVPPVGAAAAAGWVPPSGVRVRFVRTGDAPRGTVLDVTRCGRSGPSDALYVVIAR